ncbi:ABC transporter permease, partial [Candidatus Bipolaricaulota bacterium]|nr:ABC transporter permease [Candidatus Bipolaricaulota bacterium]
RLIFPFAAVGAHLVDFAISFAILAGMMAYFGFAPGLNILAVLPLTLLTILAALSVGVLVSALNTAYRDFRHLLPFLIQLWMFLSPVIYPVSILPERYRWVLWLNPLTGIIDGYRYAVLGSPLHWASLAISIAAMAAALFLGLVVFRRTERRFADIV